MADVKDSTKKAIENFCKKQIKKKRKRNGSRNKAPERDLVRTDLLPWLKRNGFSINVVEAKAVYNVKAGRYLSGQTDKGFSDMVGNDADGIACFIEAKAPGRKKVILDQKHRHQYDFIIEKIKSNCFAGCFDSLVDLQVTYSSFKRARAAGDRDKAQHILMAALNRH
jgi:hypothetical protein